MSPHQQSFVPVAPDSHFPIQNLPYGVFSHAGGAPRVGVAIGDHILDLAAVATAGHFEELALDPGVFSTNRLNALMQLPAVTRTSLRTRISELLQAGTGVLRSEPDRWLVRSETASMHLPGQIGDYVDFYSSLHHATNLGRRFGAEKAADGTDLLGRRLTAGQHALDRDAGVSEQQKTALCGIYESVFNHRQFTGRSGSMFKYEGLGSIYWHMVSKLLLAVNETYFRAWELKEDEKILGRLAGGVGSRGGHGADGDIAALG